MAFFKIKSVWNYCTYNKPFLAIILLFFCVLVYFEQSYKDSSSTFEILIFFVVDVLLFGYGMLIARDRMRGGIRLPKIMVKDCFISGVKSTILIIVFVYVQGFILHSVSSPLDFPEFDLEDMLLDFPQTIHNLYSHNPIDAFVFIVLGAILFYITTFFLEIALARLADTGSIKTAFNLMGIKKDIDTIGWWNYAKEYTGIVLTIVLFAYLNYIDIPVDILNYIWGVFFFFFMFSTQFWGIGEIYGKIKEKRKEVSS